MSKIVSFLIAIIILIAVFAVGFFGIDYVMKLVVGHKNEVITSDIVNQKVEVGRNKMMKLNLYVQQVGSQYSDTIEKGRIISQKPEAGKVTKKNRTVEVIVSLGAELVSVPYLENMILSNAKLRLKNVGLILGKEQHLYSDEVDKGKIINSQPRAGEDVNKGEKINVNISLGKVPDSSERKNKYQDLLDNIDG